MACVQHCLIIYLERLSKSTSVQGVRSPDRESKWRSIVDKILRLLNLLDILSVYRSKICLRHVFGPFYCLRGGETDLCDHHLVCLYPVFIFEPVSYIHEILCQRYVTGDNSNLLHFCG